TDGISRFVVASLFKVCTTGRYCIYLEKRKRRCSIGCIQYYRYVGRSVYLFRRNQTFERSYSYGATIRWPGNYRHLLGVQVQANAKLFGFCSHCFSGSRYLFTRNTRRYYSSVYFCTGFLFRNSLGFCTRHLYPATDPTVEKIQIYLGNWVEHVCRGYGLFNSKSALCGRRRMGSSNLPIYRLHYCLRHFDAVLCLLDGGKNYRWSNIQVYCVCGTVVSNSASGALARCRFHWYGLAGDVMSCVNNIFV